MEGAGARLCTVTRQHSDKFNEKGQDHMKNNKTTLYQKYGRLGGNVEVMINHEERRIDV